MFTGIIESTGKITGRQMHAQDLSLQVYSEHLDFSDTCVGDSIAVNGVCLTVRALGAHCFFADVSKETLHRTTLGSVGLQKSVNLEKSLRLQDRLGGHLVSGHVDALGTLVARQDQGRSTQFRFQIPLALTKYVASKGSICIDGVSLTVNEIDAAQLSVNIVPHTLQTTHFAALQVAAVVNIEVDMIARYLERLILKTGVSNGGGLTMEKWLDCGFAADCE